MVRCSMRSSQGSLSRSLALAALGARMKYLVDTPEVIWGCLDSRQWLAAAQRLLRASQVRALALTSAVAALVKPQKCQNTPFGSPLHHCQRPRTRAAMLLQCWRACKNLD